MKISPKGIKFIQQWESCELQAYPDPGTGGKPYTIGFGHTRNVKMGMKITLSVAEKLLTEDLAEVERAIASVVRVLLTQNQIDALISFVFNIGCNAFAASTLLKVLNQGNYQAAAEELLRWNKVGGKVSKGLARRRAAEKKLFSS